MSNGKDSDYIVLRYDRGYCTFSIAHLRSARLNEAGTSVQNCRSESKYTDIYYPQGYGYILTEDITQLSY